jgi:hypothetical protein
MSRTQTSPIASGVLGSAKSRREFLRAHPSLENARMELLNLEAIRVLKARPVLPEAVSLPGKSSKS